MMNFLVLAYRYTSNLGLSIILLSILYLLAEPSKQFKFYANAIVFNAKILAEELLKCGFKLATGGTDNHLLLIWKAEEKSFVI